MDPSKTVKAAISECISALEDYRDDLQGLLDDLEEKQAEDLPGGEERQNKIDEISARIDDVIIASNALDELTY